MKFFILLLFLFCVQQINSANILVLMPTPSKSHCILGDALVRGLVNKSHNVTLVTTFPQKVKPTDYRELPLTRIPEVFRELISPPLGQPLFKIQQSLTSALQMIVAFGDITKNITEEVFLDENIQKLLKNRNEHFDVIIISQFLNEALLGFAYHFKAPIIALATTGPSFITNNFVGNPQPYSYIPELFLPFSDHMTFLQRTISTLFQTYCKINQHFFVYPKQNELLHKYFPDAPDIYEAIKNIAIVLANSHVSFAYPRPLVPAMVDVGGFHVMEPKPLPNDLKQIMDNAEHGVIYFSLGTNVPGKDMPSEIRKAFIDVFAKLKQIVLWKWDEDRMDGVSKNVIIRKWFPQSDILAHPNIKLFITHGGLLSTTEAIIRGVPLLGIPVGGDQQQNVKKSVILGFTVHMDFSNITTESLTWAVNEALNNPSYTENIRKRSKIMKDQIVTPMEKAIYWIEHVIRHKGADHLRTAGMNMPLYQYLLFDVIGFLILILIVILFIFYLIIKLIIKIARKLLFKNKQKND